MLKELLETLDSSQGTHALLARYVTGTQPLAFLTADQRKALDGRLARMSIGIPALVVRSISERLRVTGYSEPRAWELFVTAQLDQAISAAFSDALAYGTGYVLIWTRNGTPTATVETPSQCAVLRDPADHSVIAGVKRFTTPDGSQVFAYLPDRVESWWSPHKAPAVSGYRLVETIPHDLGMVPLVPIGDGVSEIDPILSLTDALVKVTLDMVIASHAAGFGRRWSTGLDLVERPRLSEDGSPVLDSDGVPVVDVVSPIADMTSLPMIVSESVETKFGAFPEPGLTGFETAVKVLVSMLSATTSLPAHYLSPLTSPQVPSSDGLRAAESALVARCESKQLLYGRAVEDIGRLLLAVDTGRQTPVRVKWAPADSRSVAAEVDAVVKLVQAGILPTSYALAKLGYADDEILRIRAAKRAEALDAEGFGLASE